jgi:Flp pilus assembly protein TadG
VPSRRSRDERGSAVVEFALVLPILLLVCIALVQITALARDQLLVIQASRAAAREAAVDPDEASIRAAALEASPGLDPAYVEVTVARTGAQGEPVRVTIGYRAVIAGPLSATFLPSSVRLTADSTMRQEFP